MQNEAKEQSVFGEGAVFGEEIKAHVEANLGKIRSGFQEKWGDRSFPDVLFVRASQEQPCHVFVTCGVSNNPMNVPEEMGEYRRAELVIALPHSWPLGENSIKKEESHWPMRWLKRVGRLPHDQKTWIGQGHTFSNGDPWKPIANTNFTGALTLSPFGLRREFFQLETKQGERIKFYYLFPLYQEEIDLKLRKGSEALKKLFHKHNINFVLDPARTNVAKKRSLFRS